jgi:hypothetical protein
LNGAAPAALAAASSRSRLRLILLRRILRKHTRRKCGSAKGDGNP